MSLAHIFYKIAQNLSMFMFKGWCTLSEAWSGVNWMDLMAAQGAFGTDFYGRSILRPKVPKAPRAAMRSAQFTPLQAADRV